MIQERTHSIQVAHTHTYTHTYIHIFKLHIIGTIEGKALPSLKEKNQRAAEKWRAMSEEDKKQYVDAAKVTADSIGIPIDSWGEAHRILHNMQKNVCGVYL